MQSICVLGIVQFYDNSKYFMVRNNVSKENKVKNQNMRKQNLCSTERTKFQYQESFYRTVTK
jgi:hypothetical protein